MAVNIHSNSIRGEAARGSLVLKAAEIVLGAHILELGIVLEGVNDALALYGMGTLDIIMVREEQLLCPMEGATATNRLLWTIVPPHPHLCIVATISLNLLHARHIWWLVRV